MKIVISILKVLLGLWSITGASYMMGHYADLANPSVLAIVPGMFWMALGIVQIALAVALILSVFARFAKFAAPSAIALAVITLLGAVLYSAYGTFPGMLIWAIIPAALFAFVAYKK